MSKLLRANMVRLWKNKIFWVGFTFLTVMGAVQRISIGMDIERHFLDEAFWISALFIGFVLSAFISLFIGTEYEDGTVRNKVISGHTRSEIYFANVAVCIIAGWFMSLGCLIASLLIGIPLSGFFRTFPITLLEGICVFALSAAYAAIYCFVSMLWSNRAVTAVVCILLSIFLLFSGTVVSNRLEQDEYYYIPDASLGIGEIDDGKNSEWVRNPDYLDGTERTVYEIIFNVIPGGQSLELSGQTNENNNYIIMLLASMGWIVITSGCGMLIFHKKDLR